MGSGAGPGVRSSASGAGAWGPGSTLAVRVKRSAVSLLGPRLGSWSGVEDLGRGLLFASRALGRGPGSGILSRGLGPCPGLGSEVPSLGSGAGPASPGLCAGPGSAGRSPSPPAQRAGGAARTKAARVLQWVWVLVLCSGGRRVLGVPFLATLKLGFGNDTRKKGGDEMRKRGLAGRGQRVDAGGWCQADAKSCWEDQNNDSRLFSFLSRSKRQPYCEPFLVFSLARCGSCVGASGRGGGLGSARG